MVLASLATTVPRSFLDSLEILFFLLHLVEGVLLEALIFLLSFLLKTLVFLLSEFGMCTIARRIDGRWISSSRKRICNFHYFFIPNIVYRLPWKLLPIIQVDEFFWWLFFKVCNLSMSSFMASIRKPRSFSYWWFQNRGCRGVDRFSCGLSILFRNWTLHSQSFKFVFEILYLGPQIRICTPVLWQDWYESFFWLLLSRLQGRGHMKLSHTCPLQFLRDGGNDLDFLIASNIIAISGIGLSRYFKRRSYSFD